MNTVLIQELMRFNRLGQVIKTSLRDMKRSIRGELVMSQELEALGLSMFNGKVRVCVFALFVFARGRVTLARRRRGLSSSSFYCWWCSLF